VTAYVVDARARFEKRRLEWFLSQSRDVTSALARAKAAASQLTEALVTNPGVRQLVADLALVEARSLDNARGADAKRRRADVIATARRELEAAVQQPSPREQDRAEAEAARGDVTISVSCELPGRHRMRPGRTRCAIARSSRKSRAAP